MYSFTECHFIRNRLYIDSFVVLQTNVVLDYKRYNESIYLKKCFQMSPDKAFRHA